MKDIITLKQHDLVYGSSGSGKTTWGLILAEAIWKTHKLKTRWYLGDGGRGTIEASGMIEDGIVEVVEYINYPYPFETSMKIVQGWWPKGGEQGEILLAPPPNLGEQYGFFVFEGLTVLAGYMMGDVDGGLRNRNAKGERIKEAGIQFTDGTTQFATNSAANYGTAQEHILTRIEESRRLPGWVQWTAHETLAEQKRKLGPREGTGPTISAGIEYGPAIAGQALTPFIGASFSNTIHLHPVRKTIRRKEPDPDTKLPVDDVQMVTRAYTRRHLDPHLKSTGITYFANTRMPPGLGDMMPEYIEGINPLKYYELQASARQKAREARK